MLRSTLVLLCLARAAAEAARSPLLFRAPLAVRVVLIGFDVREDGAPAISADDVRSLLEAALPFRTGRCVCFPPCLNSQESSLMSCLKTT